MRGLTYFHGAYIAQKWFSDSTNPAQHWPRTGNGLLPDGTKVLPSPMLNHNHLHPREYVPAHFIENTRSVSFKILKDLSKIGRCLTTLNHNKIQQYANLFQILLIMSDCLFLVIATIILGLSLAIPIAMIYMGKHISQRGMDK